MDLEFTPRNVAKYVVKAIVHTKATSVTKNLITDYTQFEDDDMTVKITGNVVGWYVSDRLKPYTDKLVDKTADWYVERKNKKDQTKPAE